MGVMWKDQTPKKSPDKIVVISIYTQTLDLIERMCKGLKWPVMRLDGSLAVKKRMELVNSFNDESNRNAFCFLLSSKAGGCGINLIGANRLVLFDSDWNPATDKQAAARCWRDGQKKNCYTYRFLSSGTLEEKIFQRQLSKEGLAAVVEDKEQVNALSSDELKMLFRFRDDTPSDTHDKLKCKHCATIKESDADDSQPLNEAQVSFIDGVLEWLSIKPEATHFDVGTDTVPGELATTTEALMIFEATKRVDESEVSTPVMVSKPKAKNSKVGDLKSIRKKLHTGGFKQLSDFHKEMRHLFSNARKCFELGTPQYQDAGILQEHFETHWSSLASEISLLQGGGGARVFTEEELAGAAANIQAHSNQNSRSVSSRHKFGIPIVDKTKKPCAVGASAVALASRAVDDTDGGAIKNDSKRLSAGGAFKPQVTNFSFRVTLSLSSCVQF